MKKTTKKIISALSIVLMMCLLLNTAPMKASAAILGDINGDNTINISDAIALGRYLSGQYTLSDYSISDLNVNYVIDVVDQQILLAFLVGIIDSLPYSN